MKAYIVSNKMSIGQLSHMYACYNMFEELGYDATICIARAYEPYLLNDAFAGRYIIIGEANCSAPDVLMIWNLSTHDMKYVKKWRTEKPEMATLFVYHEPWCGYKVWMSNFIKKREDLRETIHALGRHFYSIQLIKNVGCVLLPSKSAKESYIHNDKRLNGCYSIMPLVLADEAKEPLGEKRERFSFVATASQSKGFTKYLDAVCYIASKDDDAKFEIATSTDVTSILDSRIKELEASGRMKIQCGRTLQNIEIRAAYERSVCTWLGYDRSTQSGVMCKAFMFGSPAIATKIGSFPDYINGKNGMLLERNDDVEEIYEAYCKIKQAQEDFSKCARETFLKEFYYEAHIETLRKAISKAQAAGKSSNAESRV